MDHRSFSQANGQGDVPALLRRVAATLEAFGEIEVMDMILHHRITETGDDWCHITVYFHLASDQAEP